MIYLLFSFLIFITLIFIYFFYLKYCYLIFGYKDILLFLKFISFKFFSYFFVFDIFRRYENIFSIFKLDENSIINLLDDKQVIELISYFANNSFKKVFMILINILNTCW